MFLYRYSIFGFFMRFSSVEIRRFSLLSQRVFRVRTGSRKIERVSSITKSAKKKANKLMKRLSSVVAPSEDEVQQRLISSRLVVVVVFVIVVVKINIFNLVTTFFLVVT